MESRTRARRGGHQPGIWAAVITTVAMVLVSLAGTATGSPLQLQPARAAVRTSPIRLQAPWASSRRSWIRLRPPLVTVRSLRACRTAQLGLEFGPRGRRAPDTTQVITFVNVSQHSCSLEGYPTVHLSSRRDSKMRTHQTDGYLYSVPKRLVRLEPGMAASFSVAYRNRDPQGRCPRSTSAAIQPPARKRAISVDWRIAPYGGTARHLRCGALAISPVYRGTGAAPHVPGWPVASPGPARLD